MLPCSSERAAGGRSAARELEFSNINRRLAVAGEKQGGNEALPYRRARYRFASHRISIGADKRRQILIRRPKVSALAAPGSSYTAVLFGVQLVHRVSYSSAFANIYTFMTCPPAYLF